MRHRTHPHHSSTVTGRNRVNSHPVATTIACAFALTVVVGGCQMGKSPVMAGRVGMAPSSMLMPASDSDALKWWQAATKATREVPLAARVMVAEYSTRSNTANRAAVVSTFDYVEDVGGNAHRYRMDYRAPASKRGRTIVCDGTTLWHYEPRSRVVLRRPLTTAYPRIGSDDPLALPTGGRLTLESEKETVADRPVVLVALRRANGTLMERQWIDRETARILRTEEYTAIGERTRRIELGRVDYHPAPPTEMFQPHFPAGTRMIMAQVDVPEMRQAERQAHHVHLPIRAAGYRLRKVEQARPRRASGLVPSIAAAPQFVYTNGKEAVSVFVTLSRGGNTLPSPDSHWRAVLLGKGQNGVQSTGNSHSAIAWAEANHRYIAVSKIPPAELLMVARGLVLSDPHPFNATNANDNDRVEGDPDDTQDASPESEEGSDNNSSQAASDITKDDSRPAKKI